MASPCSQSMCFDWYLLCVFCRANVRLSCVVKPFLDIFCEREFEMVSRLLLSLSSHLQRTTSWKTPTEPSTTWDLAAWTRIHKTATDYHTHTHTHTHTTHTHTHTHTHPYYVTLTHTTHWPRYTRISGSNTQTYHTTQRERRREYYIIYI